MQNSPDCRPLCLLLVGLLLVTVAHAQPASSRPRLQIINGTLEPLEIFWIKSPTERISNGRIAAGENTIVHTTAGHRFAIVGSSAHPDAEVTCEVPVQAFRYGGIPAFYTQQVSAGGLPIVASAKVNPYALKEAAYIVNKLLARRPDVLSAMVKSGSRLCILAHNEFTTDQPEWAWLAKQPVPEAPEVTPRDFRDARSRGMGGSDTDPYCSCGEENLLAYPGDPYSTESILIHELAHNIHLRGMNNIDPTFERRLKATYQAAMRAGLWKGKYASVNHHEYFAEGVQSWFDDNRENDHDHNHVNTRVELIEYDRGLADLCQEVFGDTEFRYIKPVNRLSEHMAGYEPSQAPTFRWPERLEHARAAILKSARARSAEK